MPASTIPELQAIFTLAAETLPAAGITCLLIGGFAVNHYGYTRNTLDVDLMIATEQRTTVRDVMMQAGFTNVAMHENVAFFNRPGSALRIDFLHVDQQTMTKLLVGAVKVELYGRCLSVPALSDLLAMKFFALSQAPARRMDKDLPDIAFLAVLNDLDLERDLRPLAQQYANQEIFEQVAARIRTLQE